jgi:hypothetical protein
VRRARSCDATCLSAVYASGDLKSPKRARRAARVCPRRHEPVRLLRKGHMRLWTGSSIGEEPVDRDLIRPSGAGSQGLSGCAPYGTFGLGLSETLDRSQPEPGRTASLMSPTGNWGHLTRQGSAHEEWVDERSAAGWS